MQSLNGRYYTACDVGTYSADMDVIAETCQFVTGRTAARGGAGDSSVLTAYGVFQGMRAAAEAVWGDASLRGRRVGVAGVGKVGRHLVDHLVQAGASVVVTDPYEPALRLVTDEHPEVRVVRQPPRSSSAAELDVYSPCALGDALTDEVVEALSAQVVCGAANNQLAHPGIEKQLADRGILYAPDYVVNAGGLIQVADELHGFDFERARERAGHIFETTREVFDAAAPRRRTAGGGGRPDRGAPDGRGAGVRPHLAALRFRPRALRQERDAVSRDGSRCSPTTWRYSSGSGSGSSTLSTSSGSSPCSSLASALKSVS